jgi:16S rRNA (cytosine1402-N4)-methyltransferase
MTTPEAADGRHIPVLGTEAVAALMPRAGGIYLDATFGAGGYSRLLLAVPGTRVVAIDRDPGAVRDGAALVAASEGRLTLVHDRFSHLEAVCDGLGIDRLDGVVMDVGVSSMQLDEADRGFSFRLEGPLDMRMSREGPSAADVVARAAEGDLADVIYLLGEERQSRGIARAIVAARREAPITTTKALAAIVGRVVRSKPHEIHPATRTFQALRILVNAELDELETALAAAERRLAPGGRLAVVSFHSLEDRIVKTFLAARARAAAGSRHLPETTALAPSFTLVGRKPVLPSEAETAANPRARSAKLRVAERTAAPPQPQDADARWPRLADVLRGG